MTTFRFKTNINCGGCKATVSTVLNKEPRISNWNVDTNNPDKILAVDAEGLSSDDIIGIVGQAGFKAVSVG